MPSRAALVSSIIRPRPLPSHALRLAGLTGEQERLGVDELDLTRRDRAGAELVLEPAHPHAVARAVASRRSTRKVATPRLRVRRPFGLGEHDERLPVAVRRKPLEAVEQPRIAVRVAVVSSAPRSEPPVRSVSSWAVCPPIHPTRTWRARDHARRLARTPRPEPSPCRRRCPARTPSRCRPG